MDYIIFEDYTSNNDTLNDSTPAGIMNFSSTESSLTPVLVAVNILISFLGIGGNSLVIWICGWKMKRSVVTTWYISLAISDLLFCLFLPLEVFYMISSHWPFGLVFCKVISSALFLNMYSSVFLLFLISADRCLMVLFPVWSHNYRTVRKASVAVVLMWLLAALITLPSMIFKQVTAHGSVIQCYSDYGSQSKHKAVVLTRFTFGFLLPLLMIVICFSVLGVKLRSLTVKSAKPYKIMMALLLSFFFCWFPYHTFVLLELDNNSSTYVLTTGLKVGSTLAAANSFISPVLYVFIGNDFKNTLKRSLTSRMEEAMADGLNQSRSKSVDVLKHSLEPFVITE